jgi:hypothetical protein
MVKLKVESKQTSAALLRRWCMDVMVENNILNIGFSY